ncbi:hypothetical protein EOL96_03725 [Candidatus Saccharibacteria bacterium]|nr:hypothetical protein [Candidatus Saccharibacteria bacterium]
MNTIDYISVALLTIIAAQTTFLTYKNQRSDQRRTNTDIFVDTSVLMDGRIVPIAEAGFIPGRLVIPRSVIGELQLLADNGDTDKRERARRGLDVLKQLQAIEQIDVTILQDGSRASEGVDERLLKHAKSSGGAIATIDFNLNKVASVEGITVLNVNELARTLRMSYLPGEHIKLELTTTGSDNHQAVGHIGDGTMVVVEHAKKYIGTTVEVEVIRSLQTAAGRMMFARIANQKQQPADSDGAKKKPQSKQLHQKTQVSKSHTPKTPYKSREQSTPSGADTVVSQQPPKQKQSSNTKKSNRRSSASQRESSFLDLINNQDK